MGRLLKILAGAGVPLEHRKWKLVLDGTGAMALYRAGYTLKIIAQFYRCSIGAISKRLQCFPDYALLAKERRNENAMLPVDHPSANARPVMTPVGRFESATDAAKHYGILRVTAQWRARNQSKGWFYDDESLTQRRKRDDYWQYYEAGASSTQIATLFGVRQSVVIRYLKQNHRFDEIKQLRRLGGGPEKQISRRLVAKLHRTNITPPKIAESLRCSVTAVRAALLEQGLYEGQSKIVITAEGRFSSISDAARHHGIKYGTASSRVQGRYQGWHFEADDYRPPQDRAVVTPKGHFSQLTLAAQHFDIPKSTACARAKNRVKGWRYADDDTPEPTKSKGP